MTSDNLPTCAQANEYLAEDRIMCLQIYIKKECKYTIRYIPDAKSFTDAPEDLCTLMKQRRRWSNGSLFGTSKVIVNFVSMLGMGTKHHCCRTLMMIIYLPYLLSVYLLNFFLVGSLMVTIDVFVKESLMAVTDAPFTTIEPFYLLFSWSYAMMLVLTVIVSLSLPIDRAMTYLKAISFILCSLFLGSLIGICYYMSV